MFAGKHKVVCQGQLKTSGDSKEEVLLSRNGKWRHRVCVFVFVFVFVLVLVLVCVCGCGERYLMHTMLGPLWFTVCVVNNT